MAKDLNVHTELCLGCSSRPATMSTGHVHLANGETIFGGWCGEVCCSNTPKSPKSECNHSEGCYGYYDKKKHGSFKPEWGD
jgi:hypothetical protein